MSRFSKSEQEPLEIKLGYFLAGRFQESNVTWMELMVNGTSFKYMLCCCYRVLLRMKGLSPIESLPIEEKQRIFSIVKDFEDKDKPLDSENLTNTCKALYALEWYLCNPQNQNQKI